MILYDGICHSSSFIEAATTPAIQSMTPKYMTGKEEPDMDPRTTDKLPKKPQPETKAPVFLCFAINLI
jgi:hypothetical protein